MKLDPYYARKLECMNDSAGIIEVKGLLYSVCADFDSSAEYRDVASGHHQLLYVIFRFIENNYMNDCTLAALAKYTTYDYAYLSRYFKNATGLAYNDYVTQYRISHACYLLQSTEKTILDVSVESGFNSLRSMNRNFKNQLGVPPAKYRMLSKGEEHKISDYDKDGKVR